MTKLSYIISQVRQNDLNKQQVINLQLPISQQSMQSSSSSQEQRNFQQSTVPHNLPQQTVPQEQNQAQQVDSTSREITNSPMAKRFTNHQNKSSLQQQVCQLQSKLFHQIILKGEFSNNDQLQKSKNVLVKLSESVHQGLEEVLGEINKLEERLVNPLLSNHQKQQVRQEILEKRMEQLANTKVLCHTYKHHQYRLVLAELHISHAYQQLKCHQQAITHLQLAIRINDIYRHLNQDVQYLHTIMLSHLAQSQFHVEDYQRGLQNLNIAIQLQEKLKTHQYQVHDFFTLNLTSKILTSTNRHNEAISFAQMTIHSARSDHGKQSLEYAQATKTLAQAFMVNKNYQQALQSIKEGINILQQNLPEKQQTIIEFHTKLTEITLKHLSSTPPIQHQQSHYDTYIQTMKRRYQVIENTYGYRDKRAIREKRHLASSYLKYGKVQQAEEQLEDILEIEETVYGEKSVEVGKTLKLLGTVAISKNQTSKADRYLKKSMGIFHDQGQANLEKQVQAKLLVLTGKAKFTHAKQ